MEGHVDGLAVEVEIYLPVGESRHRLFCFRSSFFVLLLTTPFPFVSSIPHEFFERREHVFFVPLPPRRPYLLCVSWPSEGALLRQSRLPLSSEL